MWMGGNVPLGYDAKDRTLVVNVEEAETVESIYALYERHGWIRQVQIEAQRLGLRTKRRANAGGDLQGGRMFSRGHIHLILTNPVYAGRIRHKETAYEGAHDAIIDPERWEAVQRQLKDRSARRRGGASGTERSPLAGKLFDETGDRLTPSHANKKGRRYRYYVSHRLVATSGAADATAWRLPAEALERSVADAIAKHLGTPSVIAGLMPRASVAGIEQIETTLVSIGSGLRSDDGRARLGDLVRSAMLSPGSISIELNAEAIAKGLDQDPESLSTPQLHFEAPFALRRRGVEARIVIGGGAAEIDDALVRNLAKAIAWLDEMKSGGSKGAIMAREGVSRQRFNQVLKLAFLAPDLVARIVRGEHPEGLTADSVMRARRLDLWTDQRVWATRLSG